MAGGAVQRSESAIGIGVDEASEAEAAIVGRRAIGCIKNPAARVSAQIHTRVSAEINTVTGITVDRIAGDIRVGNCVDQNSIVAVVADVVADDRRVRRFRDRDPATSIAHDGIGADGGVVVGEKSNAGVGILGDANAVVAAVLNRAIDDSGGAAAPDRDAGSAYSVDDDVVNGRGAAAMNLYAGLPAGDRQILHPDVDASDGQRGALRAAIDGRLTLTVDDDIIDVRRNDGVLVASTAHQ